MPMDNASLARIEATMQRIQEKQEILSQNYLRREDYIKAHDAVVQRVDYLEKDIQRRVEDANKQGIMYMAEIDRKINDRVADTAKHIQATDDRLDALEKNIEGEKIKNLTWIVGFLVSALMGGGVIQLLHLFTGK